MATLTILSFVAALGCGLIAGTFFAFSVFVMRALASISAPAGIAAMQAINVVVVNPLFLGVFLGTAVLCVIVSLLAFAGSEGAEPVCIWIASLAYLVGTFGVTMLFNVPLNNRLAKVDPASAEGEKLWRTLRGAMDALEPYSHHRGFAGDGGFRSEFDAIGRMIIPFAGTDGEASRCKSNPTFLMAVAPAARCAIG